jgi:hypothetical protein
MTEYRICFVTPDGHIAAARSDLFARMIEPLFNTPRGLSIEM